MVCRVNNSNSLEDAPCHMGSERKAPDPCSIIIFGASGDLTARKLIPAFYHLCREKQMPSAFRIIGFARREKTDDEVNHILSLMQQYGAIEYAQDKAKQFLTDALAVLDTIRWNGDRGAVELLRDVARFSIERQW